MIYVDLRKFGEAREYQYDLPSIPEEFDTCDVLEVTYRRWQGRSKFKIYGKVLLWDESISFVIMMFTVMGRPSLFVIEWFL